MSWRSRMAPRVALATGVAAFVAISPGWTGPTWASAPTAHTRHHTRPQHKLGPLSGKWSGSYSGAFSGTFSLNWQESGTHLVGTIMISGFHNAPTTINGTVKGASIQFGTVGSESITYSGSVSSASMSGTWQIQAGGQALGSGSWTASESS